MCIRCTVANIDANLVITYTYTELRRIHIYECDVYINKNMTYTYFFVVDYSFYGFSTYLFSTLLYNVENTTYTTRYVDNTTYTTIFVLYVVDLYVIKCVVLYVVLYTLTHTYMKMYVYVPDLVRNQQQKKGVGIQYVYVRIRFSTLEITPTDD